MCAISHKIVPPRRNPQLALPLDLLVGLGKVTFSLRQPAQVVHTRNTWDGPTLRAHCRSKVAKQQIARMDAGITTKKIKRSNRSMP